MIKVSVIAVFTIVDKDDLKFKHVQIESVYSAIQVKVYNIWR
jgi:hypothetical protein